MKKLLFTVIILLIFQQLNSQTVLISENFDNYVAGSLFVQQAGHPWATWSNQPGGPEDVPVTTAQSRSIPNSLYFNNAQDDIILKLGNKTSGKYSILFYYYIPSGKGAYFNIQHFEQPGIEWAIEVYFGSNGTGRTTVNNVNLNFGHALNSWIKIETVINLDLDSAWLYIDDSMVRAWKFSMQSNAPTGTKQLGGINFYGGSLPGQSPEFYLDDVTYTELQAGIIPPTIQLSTTSIATDGTNNEVFTIKNIGQQPLEFIAYPIFPSTSTLFNAVNGEEEILLELPNTNNRNVELSFVTGPLSAGLGFANTVTVRSAVKFDYSVINPHIGRKLTSVIIGVNDMPSGTTKVLVYDRGLYVTPGAGNLLAEKTFTPSASSEIIVNLNQPIYLDGKDIWIGWICEAIAGTYPIGLDGGPRVSGVNWLSIGPGWSELTPSIDNNLYIKGILQDNPIHQWVSVSPQSGIVNPGESQPITLSFNLTNMIPGNYFAQISIGCNDQTKEYTEIDVYLSVIDDVKDEQNMHVIVYPNPTKNHLVVNSSNTIEKIELFSMTGQRVRSETPMANNYIMNVTSVLSGYYILKVHTKQNVIEQKINIRN